MNPSCFICGTKIPRRTKIPTDNIPKLLQLFCKLESVTDIDPEEWKYFCEIQQSNSCTKCYDVLKNMERVHDILIETETQLKAHLKQVENLFVQSEARQNSRHALWMNSDYNCSKIRKSILKKVTCNSNELSHANVKEELENNTDSLGDHFDPVLVTEGHDGINDRSFGMISKDDNFSEAATAFYDDFQNEDEFVNEMAEAGDGDRDDSMLKTRTGLKHSKNKKVTEIEHPPCVRLKRKIIVIAEEDNIMPEKVAIRKTSCRAAKLIAEIAMQQYKPEDEEVILKTENKKVNESEAICNEDNGSDDAEPELKPRPRKNARKKLPTRIIGKSGRVLFLPMLVADENLFLFRWGTYVQRTYTHLLCKAYKCSFQVEFDYYPSFQKMKEHILLEHRDRVHRQKIPHPCLLCDTLCQNQEEFRKHIRTHSQFQHPSKAICECCLMITIAVHVRSHAFKHKSEEEKAIARATNDGTRRCFQLKESEKTEKKWVCDFENCGKAFKSGGNLRRHKQIHLSMDQRTDFTVCPECGVQILKDTLSKHLIRMHHPETVDRVLLCPICDKRYLPSDKASLLKHIQVHKGEKPYLCPECGIHCTNLKYHMAQHHNKDKKPDPLPCEFCDLVYINKKSLHMHLKRTHPDKYVPKRSFNSQSRFYSGNDPEAKPKNFIGPIQRFPCQICDVICKYRFTLRRHMSRKHGERDIRRRRRRATTSIKEAIGPEEEEGEYFNEQSDDEEEMETSEAVQSTINKRTDFQGSSTASGFPNVQISNFPKFEN